jgi:hypothetical protein
MDKLKKYRETIEKILSEYAAIAYAYGDIERRTIFNHKTDSYLLYVVGWDGRERVHGIISHIDIIDGKIWIQRDGTEDGLAADLEREGVPKNDIVLAFHAPELRKHTEYAIA